MNLFSILAPFSSSRFILHIFFILLFCFHSFLIFFYIFFFLKDDTISDYTLPPGIDSPLDGSTVSLSNENASSSENSVATPRRPAPSIPAGLGGAKRVAPLPPPR